MEHWKIVFTENKALSSDQWTIVFSIMSIAKLSSEHWMIVFRAVDDCLHLKIGTGKLSSQK